MEQELKTALDEALTRLKALSDPLQRTKESHAVVGLAQEFHTAAQAVRNEAMNATLKLGQMTAAQLAIELKISKGRVSQLTKGGPPPERLFLGSGTVTVALGGKFEGEKDRPGPVIAQEDFQTYEHLRELAEQVGLEIKYEMIPPPGHVRLNRDNLVVICGPRLSPMIEQILESDPHLGFAKDDKGWHLIDRTSGTEYRSPIDAGEHGDVAYVGRLPRPDGKGTFLYVAGIHAMGSGGVVHWLTNELSSAYAELKTKRFSALISSRFDPHTLEITESRRITPFYRPEGV